MIVSLPSLEEWLPTTTLASAGGGDGGADFHRIKRFIEDRLAEPIQVSDLSDEVDLSRSHFTRVFTERVGMPPWKYVRKRRVSRAAELLEAGVPPSEVAFRTGFSDQSHLTRVFRKARGTTPGEYQKDCADGRTNLQDRKDCTD